MFKIALKSMLLAFSSASFAFGFDEWSFEDESKYCIDLKGEGNFQKCTDLGYVYENSFTEAVTSYGEVSFKTKTIKLAGGFVLTQNSHDINFSCLQCTESNSFSHFIAALEEASINSSFSTRRTSRNNRRVNENTQSNNGSSFSEDFKNFADGLKSFSDAAFTWLEQDDGKNQLVVVDTPSGKTLVIVNSKTQEVKYIANISNVASSSNGETSFTANLTDVDQNEFIKKLEELFGQFGGGGSGGCRITYTRSGENEELVANVTCW